MGIIPLIRLFELPAALFLLRYKIVLFNCPKKSKLQGRLWKIKAFQTVMTTTKATEISYAAFWSSNFRLGLSCEHKNILWNFSYLWKRCQWWTVL